MVWVYMGCPKHQYLKVCHMPTQIWLPDFLSTELIYSSQSPIPTTRTTPRHLVITRACCSSDILTSNILLQPSLLLLQLFPLPVLRLHYYPCLAMAKHGRIQLSDFYMPRVLQEKITPPSRLGPLSITDHWSSMSTGLSTLPDNLFSHSQDGCMEAHTICGAIFKKRIQN